MPSGIEVTARCPALLSQYRLNKVNLEVDGRAHVISWDQPFYQQAAPGPHKISVNVQGLLMKGPTRHLDVSVDAGQITEVTYSLSLISVMNPGKLVVTGNRPASALQCPVCGKTLPAEARFCMKCGAKMP